MGGIESTNMVKIQNNRFSEKRIYYDLIDYNTGSFFLAFFLGSSLGKADREYDKPVYGAQNKKPNNFENSKYINPYS